MTQETTLFMPCIPPITTSQQKGARIVSRTIRFFKKPAVAAAERQYVRLLKRYRPASWDKIEAGPVRLDVDFVWSWRSYHTIADRAHSLIYCVTKPDCSNAIKLLEDCMTTADFWKDDCQVASLHVNKFFGDVPGISIYVKKLNERMHDHD